jgi:hypothetical protein
VSFDSRGRAIAGWIAGIDLGTDCGYEFKAAVKPPSQPWGTPKTIVTVARCGDIDSAAVAIDPQGGALGVWSRHSRSQPIQGVLGATLGARHRRPITLGHGDSPQVVFDLHGTAVAIWNALDGTLKASTFSFSR